MTREIPGAEPIETRWRRRFAGRPGGNRTDVPTRPLSDLRGAAVLVGDHHVGQVTDLILDPVEDTLLGFELRSLAGRSYFLPLALTLMRTATWPRRHRCTGSKTWPTTAAAAAI